MPDPLEGLDLTQDLGGNGQDPFGGQPYHGDAVNPNQVPNKPIEVDDTTKPEPEKSLRDTLSDAFKGKQTPQLDTGDRPQGEQPPLSPEGEAPAVAQPDLIKVGERWHHRDGRFASQADIDAFNNAQAGTPASPALPPYTQFLSDVEKQQYGQLTPEMRSFLDRTVDQVAQQAARYQEYGQLEQLIGPRRQLWAQEGMNSFAALNSLLQLSDFAGRDPSQFVLWFAEQHRLDLDAILDERDAAQAGSGMDPTLAPLVEEVRQLRDTVSNFTTQASDKDVNANMQVIQQFMAEANQDGSLKYPHFQDVAGSIGQYVANIKANQPFLSPYETLKAAYDFACFNDPTVRGKIQAGEASAIAAKKAQEADKARLAGSSINGGPAGGDGGNSTNPARSLREELMYQYNQSVAN